MSTGSSIAGRTSGATDRKKVEGNATTLPSHPVSEVSDDTSFSELGASSHGLPHERWAPLHLQDPLHTLWILEVFYANVFFSISLFFLTKDFLLFSFYIYTQVQEESLADLGLS